MSKRVEDFSNTQRFRVYTKIVEQKIGFDTFAHFSYAEISGYLLVNLEAGDIQSKEKSLIRMFADTYENLLDV